MITIGFLASADTGAAASAFGVNPNPGVAELQGSTTNTHWQLSALAPLTT